eukprot:TRINITY_DN4593_c0_g1_i1.p2 TRINITY_DN4593_c0_g1~~TRINITY_DN4593_c0_g1_i1.p2  ORF type:complete len:147 (+),score=32.35 TRINITY_DN4593_c0_g1_i1:59-442(+)
MNRANRFRNVTKTMFEEAGTEMKATGVVEIIHTAPETKSEDSLASFVGVLTASFVSSETTTIATEEQKLFDHLGDTAKWATLEQCAKKLRGISKEDLRLVEKSFREGSVPMHILKLEGAPFSHKVEY